MQNKQHSIFSGHSVIIILKLASVFSIVCLDYLICLSGTDTQGHWKFYSKLLI